MGVTFCGEKNPYSKSLMLIESDFSYICACACVSEYIYTHSAESLGKFLFNVGSWFS